jgi:hypothetical protein
MISAECPETYVSSSRRSRATLHADVAVDDAASAPGLEHPRRFVDESQSPLTMRQTPTDPLDRVDKCNACRAIGGGGVRPAFGRLSHVVDPHGQMKPIQNMAFRSQTCRLTKRTRSRGAIAQDRHRRAGRRARTYVGPRFPDVCSGSGDHFATAVEAWRC